MKTIEKVKELGISKGTYLSSKQLQSAIGKNVEWGDLLSIRDYIHKNYDITCKVEGNGLRLLTSPENVTYANKMTWLKVFGAKWWFRQQTRGTNIKELSKSERDEYHRNIEQTGKVIQAIDSEIKQLLPLNIDSYQSTVPKIFK